MFSSSFIRDIRIEGGLVLSPMSGVTTSAFRRLIRELNHPLPGLLVTEFVSVEGMTRNVPKTLQMMRFKEEERPLAVQIFGYDISRMRDAALMVQEAGADIVDINCGCPAPKVVKKGGGAQLMREPHHLKNLLRAVRDAVTIPLTVKIRSGWSSADINAIDVARIAEDEGVEALSVHPRSRKQMYRGEADWELVSKIAEMLKIPVFGSGDVKDLESARKFSASGVAGFYIGRAALNNPLIFSGIALGQKRRPEGDDQLLKIIYRYIELLREDFSKEGCVGKIKQLVSQMCRGRQWRNQVLLCRAFDEVLKVLDDARHRKPAQVNSTGMLECLN